MLLSQPAPPHTYLLTHMLLPPHPPGLFLHQHPQDNGSPPGRAMTAGSSPPRDVSPTLTLNSHRPGTTPATPDVRLYHRAVVAPMEPPLRCVFVCVCVWGGADLSIVSPYHPTVLDYSKCLFVIMFVMYEGGGVDDLCHSPKPPLK
jgi:hypothetical protein